MIDRAKRSLRAFGRARPGYRFRERYNRRRRSTSGRLDPRNLLYLGGGVAIIIVGVLLAPVPGPGGVIGFVGLALLASLFLPLARALDRGELRGRGVARRAGEVWWMLPLAMKVVIGLLAALIAVAVAYGAYQVLASR